MQDSYRKTFARSMMLAALSSISILAHAQTSATEFLKDVQVSGFLDMYYQYSGNQPPAGTFLPFRNFDVRSDNFQIAAAYLSLSKATTKDNPFGFTLNLLAGKDADIETAGEPNGSQDDLKYLHQAYVTYAAPGNLTFDLGKFQTWIGLESPFAVNNDLYSLSFVFTLGQPIYHAGVRATKAFGPLTVGLYGVNGWNEAEDSNDSKSYGASLSDTFGKVSASLNYYGGNEGSTGTNGFFIGSTGGTENVQLGDLVLSSQILPNLKLSANGDYATVNRVSSGAQSGHYSSYDVVAKFQFSKSFSVAARYDNFFDTDGIRSGFAGGARFNSGVLGCQLVTGAHSDLRFEIRHDESNRGAFEDDNASAGRRARTTYTLAHIFKF